MRVSAAHKAFDTYERTLADYGARHATNEGAVRFAFQTLLNTFLPTGWALLGEQTLPGKIRPDGLVKDRYNLTRGLWEAKDTGDTLEDEIRAKLISSPPSPRYCNRTLPFPKNCVSGDG